MATVNLVVFNLGYLVQEEVVTLWQTYGGCWWSAVVGGGADRMRWWLTLNFN